MLDVIEGTGLTLHHMNKNRTIVHRDPFCVLLTGHAQRMNMRRGTNKIIDLVGYSRYLRVTLSLADQHVLHRRLFDLAQVDRYDSLPFTVPDTFDNGIHQFFCTYFFHIFF